MTGRWTIALTPPKSVALAGALLALLALTATTAAWLGRAGGPEGCAEAAEESCQGQSRGGAEEPAAGEARELSLSPAAVALAGIELVTAARGELSVGADAPAEIRLNPERVAHVASLVPGQLRKITASLGDRVKAGARLAVVRSVAFGEARARLPQARAALDVAKSNFDRQQRLRDEGIGSERALLEAKGRLREARALHDAARAGLSVFGAGAAGGAEFALLSPIDGIVIERHAAFGEAIDPEDRLFVVADLSRVWVVGRVYEQQVAAARVGAAATFRTHAYPGRSWQGQLSYVASTLDEASRTLEIRMELDNPDGVLKPGMFARITLAVDIKKNVLNVPTAAVQTQGGESIVFVSKGGGRFERRPVELGIRGPAAVEVLGGLAEGDEIVTKGSFILKSELDKASFDAD